MLMNAQKPGGIESLFLFCHGKLLFTKIEVGTSITITQLNIRILGNVIYSKN